MGHCEAPGWHFAELEDVIPCMLGGMTLFLHHDVNASPLSGTTSKSDAGHLHHCKDDL